MISVTINLDTSRFDRMMSDFPAAMARAQRVALNKIGKAVAAYAQDAIKNPGLRPSPWAPRKKSYKHPPLLRSTGMYNKISYRVTGRGTVIVGSPHVYSIYHQMGTKKMPARPFFPFYRNGQIMPSVMREIDHKVRGAYEAELEKLRR